MKQGEGEHPLGVYGQMLAFIIFLILWSADTFYWQFFSELRQQIPLLVRGSLFFVLLVLSFTMIKKARHLLNLAAREHRAATSGIYQYSRHPIYLGILIFYAALCFLSASLLSFMVLAFIAIYYDFLARYEEKYLYLKFGEAYLNYWKQSPKWIGYKKKRI